MINESTAAKQAVQEAERRIDGELPVSDVEAAKQYVSQAIKILDSQSGGYDPHALATDLARTAVVEYAKARLLGRDPHNTPGYVQASDRWSKVAAAEYHQQRQNL